MSKTVTKRNETGFAICDICDQVCKPIALENKVRGVRLMENSEWYCPNCHKSYEMDADEARQLIKAGC